ncbi:hypothetical protein Acsp04_46580 [Actinomadura sp. NBRC 104425]|uniref:phosphatase PAP2 family protein n=1 Tax=Actinomadura sp. NBRC 104425 TaxID=3032204 RepID=UPI0024A2CFC1|nr:phosphatase PAP2 family protein [Actinomadura sp. NBRC 104425]GLZ14423.1 hypothetical protein Acsp04_46580 [Actinomadura sp. NBRC 104425]
MQAIHRKTPDRAGAPAAGAAADLRGGGVTRRRIVFRGPLWRALHRLDRRAFDRVAAARLPGLEYVLPRLSRAADHGVLWFTAAGALGMTRRARLRRAGLRGAIAIAVAAPAVNLVGKHAFGRRRPAADLVPPIRIRFRLPTSPAFPSGHSASAAAFATGAALEAPAAVAAPIALTACAVAFSRVYTGAHYPGDVLAGLGIGLAAGLGTRLMWPARPPVARAARTAAEHVASHPEGRGAVAVVNAGSGWEVSPASAEVRFGKRERVLAVFCPHPHRAPPRRGHVCRPAVG